MVAGAGVDPANVCKPGKRLKAMRRAWCVDHAPCSLKAYARSHQSQESSLGIPTRQQIRTRWLAGKRGAR